MEKENYADMLDPISGIVPTALVFIIGLGLRNYRIKKQHGKYFGWTAQIIQHEIDHCNGDII